MATLKEDIKTQAKWVVKAFGADGFKLDYSIHSFMEIDRFFNKNTHEGKAVKSGRLAQNLGPILFSVGSYVGETIIKTVPGSMWETDDNDPEGEITASVKFPDGTMIWPIQKVMKRFQNGAEDSLYVYGHQLTKSITNESFDETYWSIDKEDFSQKDKPWWKFW